MDRIKNEILNSYCFSLLKKKHSDFMSFAESKIIPVQGDLVQENLAMPESDRQLLIDECHVIINNAASVSFNEPI